MVAVRDAVYYDGRLVTDRNMRNGYHRLLIVPQWVSGMIADIEHTGVFTRGIETNSRGHGEAVNVDVYGYDYELDLAVIQIRKCYITKYGNSVRKQYYLIGRDQSQLFAHPIEPPIRSQAALATPESLVQYVLTKIWDCKPSELPNLIRQGDIALLPVAEVPAAATAKTGVTPDSDGVMMTIRDSHRLRAAEILECRGRIFCRGLKTLTHTKRQHKHIRGRKNQVYRVLIGRRDTAWHFTAPTAD